MMTNFYGISLPDRSDKKHVEAHLKAGSSASTSKLDDISRFFEILRPRSSPFQLLRLGGSGDGAYLVPNDLAGIAACFSPGVNNFKNFEDELSLKWNFLVICVTFQVMLIYWPLLSTLHFRVLPKNGFLQLPILTL
jgi:hypothetical protein